jgi:hypothetical protein
MVRPGDLKIESKASNWRSVFEYKGKFHPVSILQHVETKKEVVYISGVVTHCNKILACKISDMEPICPNCKAKNYDYSMNFVFFCRECNCSWTLWQQSANAQLQADLAQAEEILRQIREHPHINHGEACILMISGESTSGREFGARTGHRCCAAIASQYKRGSK